MGKNSSMSVPMVLRYLDENLHARVARDCELLFMSCNIVETVHYRAHSTAVC
jgi:hypothetical protein